LHLADLGFDAWFAEAFEPHNRDGVIPARVAARHHGPCELLTARGRLGGLPEGRLTEDELPVAGDWVVARPLPGERKAMIEAVLPRKSAFTRKEPWRRTVEQVVAANVDVAFLVTAFGRDLSPRRTERYLVAARESGAHAAIVANKVDLSSDSVAELEAVEAVAGGVPVLTVSAHTGQGLDRLRAYLEPGRTVALLGSSGVGKSTLANRLVGRNLLKVAPVSRGGRGRHTTVIRELVPVPGGGLLLDTPGLRELQLWAGEGSVDETFVDIAELAARCRFSDCTHEHEPGCAVARALSLGTLSQERLASFRKLQRELRALALRQSRRSVRRPRGRAQTRSRQWPERAHRRRST
jgi:ribosome biogenesis GTPase